MGSYGPEFLLTLDDYTAVGFVDRDGTRWAGYDTKGRQIFSRKDFDGAQAAVKGRKLRMVSTGYYRLAVQVAAATDHELHAMIARQYSSVSEVMEARAELARRARLPE